jgi:uncharacterized protein
MVAYNSPLTNPATWKKKSPYFIKASTPKSPASPPAQSKNTRGLTVPLCDDIKIYVDIYHPLNHPFSDKIPCVIVWTPVFPRLGGRMGSMRNIIPIPAPIETFAFDTDVDVSRLSKYTVFEAPDPVVWCPRGYAILVSDPRSSSRCWYSEGVRLRRGRVDQDATFNPIEGANECDLIESTAKLPWCSGKIGLGGGSYLVQSRWMV